MKIKGDNTNLLSPFIYICSMAKNEKAKNKDSLTPESGPRRKNSRTKGHSYERWLAKYFREQFNYNFCKTSREASRMLDDCGVDLSGLPYNIQAKSGYKGHRPKPDIIFGSMVEKLVANFPADDPIHKRFKLLFHKLDGHKPENHLVTMQFGEFIELLKGYEKSKNNGKLPICDVQVLRPEGSEISDIRNEEGRELTDSDNYL